MDIKEIESAIKSDLQTIPNLKLDIVPAKKFYGKGFSFIFKLSFKLLTINTLIHWSLILMGFYHLALSPANLIITWFIGFLFCLLIGFKLSKFSLIKNMIKGQLKTEVLIKEVFSNLKWICFGVYIVVYFLMSMLTTAGMESDNGFFDDFFIFTGVAIISQFAAYLITTAITTFVANIEFDRLGMASVFNLLVETFFDDRKKESHHER